MHYFYMLLIQLANVPGDVATGDEGLRDATVLKFFDRHAALTSKFIQPLGNVQSLITSINSILPQNMLC